MADIFLATVEDFIPAKLAVKYLRRSEVVTAFHPPLLFPASRRNEQSSETSRRYALTVSPEAFLSETRYCENLRIAESIRFTHPFREKKEKIYVTHKGLNLKKLLRKSAIAERAADACLALRSRFFPGGGSGSRPKFAFIGWKGPVPGEEM